jgi:hypothetical protein
MLEVQLERTAGDTAKTGGMKPPKADGTRGMTFLLEERTKAGTVPATT